MFVRAGRLLLLSAVAVAAVPPAAARAQQFEYAVGSWRYRAFTNVSITQEVMGQKNDFTLSSGEKFTMALARPARDTIAMTVTVDSVGSQQSMGPSPDMSSLVGTQVFAWLSPSGALYSSKLPSGDANGQLAAVGDEVTRVLPHVRVALAQGAVWTDTLRDKVSQNGMDIDRVVVSEYTVAGDTVIGQEKAWKLARKSTSTSTGKGAAQGQAMTMEGTSAGTGVVYVSAKGVFMGSASDENAKAKITISANGLEVSVGTTAKTRVDRLD